VAKNWNILLNQLLISLKFKPFEEEPCLYTRVNNGVITILFVYVDDLYIASNSNRVLERLPKKLAAHYKLKILGVPRQLLGVEIKWADDFSTVHISIKKLIVALLAQCGMLAAEPKDTPLEPGIQFSKKDLPTRKKKFSRSHLWYIWAGYHVRSRCITSIDGKSVTEAL
jgi:hypothetical protein